VSRARFASESQKRGRPFHAPKGCERADRVGGDPLDAGRARANDETHERVDQENEGDEEQLPGLDSEIEGEQRRRYLAGREADFREGPGEAEPVEESEAAGDQPGEASHETRTSPARPGKLHGEEKDARGAISIGAWGTRARPSAARVSVMLCPIVKAVIVRSSIAGLAASRRSPSTKSRWSGPVRMWLTPNLP